MNYKGKWDTVFTLNGNANYRLVLLLIRLDLGARNLAFMSFNIQNMIFSYQAFVKRWTFARYVSWHSLWWIMVSSMYLKAQVNRWWGWWLSLPRWYLLSHMEQIKKKIRQSQRKRHLPFNIRICGWEESMEEAGHFNLLICHGKHLPGLLTWLVPWVSKFFGPLWQDKNLVGVRIWAIREMAWDSHSYVWWNSQCLEG